MSELVTECIQEETNKGQTLQDKHCAGTSGGQFLLLRLHSTKERKVRKGVRAQTHNEKETRFIIKQRKKQYMKKHNKGNINWRATPLVGHPSGRLHPLVGYTLWQATPSGRLHPLVGYPSGRLPRW